MFLLGVLGGVGVVSSQMLRGGHHGPFEWYGREVTATGTVWTGWGQVRRKIVCSMFRGRQEGVIGRERGRGCTELIEVHVKSGFDSVVKRAAAVSRPARP